MERPPLENALYKDVWEDAFWDDSECLLLPCIMYKEVDAHREVLFCPAFMVLRTKDTCRYMTLIAGCFIKADSKFKLGDALDFLSNMKVGEDVPLSHVTENGCCFNPVIYKDPVKFTKDGEEWNVFSTVTEKEIITIWNIDGWKSVSYDDDIISDDGRINNDVILSADSNIRDYVLYALQHYTEKLNYHAEH